jgi:hypothetical protein
MKRGITLLLAALFVCACCVCCGSPSGSGVNPCNDTIPAACGQIAHCVLDGDQYLQGELPATQTFIVRTTGPKTVTFSFTFDNREAAGTGLTLTSTEPDCSQQSSYSSQGDLFELAGSSGVLSFPIQMTQTGDHLVQFKSDAYCSYQLSYE